jgi:uncharacterized protein (TIGR03083 family)
MPDHLAYLRADSAAIADLLRGPGLDREVPGCPGWARRDLGLHLGVVQRWATAVVQTGERLRQPEAEVADEALAAWFTEGADALVEALETAGDRPAWVLAGAPTTAFWRRRQAVEAVVHRVDAERSAGIDRPVPETLAADGIDEVVDLLHPRQVALGRTPPASTSAVLHGDAGRSWTVGAGPCAGSVSGSTSDLLLLLWRRRETRDPVFAVDGDGAALTALLQSGLAP